MQPVRQIRRLLLTHRAAVIYASLLLAAVLYTINTYRTSSLSAAHNPHAVTAYTTHHRAGITPDPPCPHQSIYTCSGYCPYITPDTVACDFLPRATDEYTLSWVQAGIPCQPAPDQCPTYNAWLKDNLPLTPHGVDRMPVELVVNYTLDGQVPFRYEYMYRGSELGSKPTVWTKDHIDGIRQQVRQREPFGLYHNTELYAPLDAYKPFIQGHRHAVIGSEQPWVEAALLEYGAAHVTTVEYGVIESQVSNLHTILPHVLSQRLEEQHSHGEIPELFDTIWIYSSIEHDGLGRYSDPLNPYGDMQTMTKLSCILKPGGLLFLAVPTSSVDGTIFNLAYIYGPTRLPLTFRQYHFVQVFDAWRPQHPAFDYSWQPVVVLQNKIGCAVTD